MADKILYAKLLQQQSMTDCADYINAVGEINPEGTMEEKIIWFNQAIDFWKDKLGGANFQDTYVRHAIMKIFSIGFEAGLPEDMIMQRSHEVGIDVGKKKETKDKRITNYTIKRKMNIRDKERRYPTAKNIFPDHEPTRPCSVIVKYRNDNKTLVEINWDYPDEDLVLGKTILVASKDQYQSYI